MTCLDEIGARAAPSARRSCGMAVAAVALALTVPAQAVSQTVPTPFLKGSVSSDRNDYNLSLSADRRLMVFARSDAEFANARIMVSERLDGGEDGWSPPQPIAFSDVRYRDSDPWLTPDGLTLYFVSDRPAPARGNRRDLDIWRAVRRDGDWQAPEHLGEVNSAGEELGPEVHDGVLYFATALRSGLGGLDIYFAIASEDGFGPRQPMPEPINSPESESDFTLSPEGEKALLWRSVGGRGLLHLTCRQADGQWTIPSPLPERFNPGAFNFTPAFSRQDQITFASDVERLGQARGLADIYEVRSADALDCR